MIFGSDPALTNFLVVLGILRIRGKNFAVWCSCILASFYDLSLLVVVILLVVEIALAILGFSIALSLVCLACLWRTAALVVSVVARI